jgi:hypothetical protein
MTTKTTKTALIALLSIVLSVPATMQYVTADPNKTIEDDTVYNYLATKIKEGSWTETRSTSAIDAVINYDVTSLGESKVNVNLVIETTSKVSDRTTTSTISYVLTKDKGIGIQDKFIVEFPNGESMTVKQSRENQPKTTSIQVNSDGVTRLGLADGSFRTITPTSYGSGAGWVWLSCNDYLSSYGYADCDEEWTNCGYHDFWITGYGDSVEYPGWWQNEWYSEYDTYNYYCIVPYYFDEVVSEISGGGLYRSDTFSTSSGTFTPDDIPYGGYSLNFVTNWDFVI